MTSNIRRHCRVATVSLAIWSVAGLVAAAAETADVKPAPVGGTETEATTGDSDALREQAASKGGEGSAADTVQPGEIRSLRERVETAETQIQLLKSVVVQALRAQSAAEAALRREREARDAASGAGSSAAESEELARHLEAMTDSLNRLREDVAALRAQGPGDQRPADAPHGGLESKPVGAIEETEPAPAAEVDPFLESGVGGEYTPLIEGESAAFPANDAPAGATDGQMEVGQVHFNPGSAKLTPGGQRKTLEAAERIKAMEATKVRIVGYADTVGDAAYNQQLSAHRARSIEVILERVGLPGDMVEIVGKGEDGTPEPTADQVSEPLNRCAGIFVVMDSPK